MFFPEIMALSLPYLAVSHIWLFLFVGSLAALIFGLGKVGFGAGLGILAVPVMIFACGGQAMLATAIVLPLLIAADYVGMKVWWRKWDARVLLDLGPGIAVGIAAGSWVLWYLRTHSKIGAGSYELMLAIGIISLMFVILQLIRWRLHRDWVFQPVFWQASLVGICIGVTTTLAHSAGPVMGMYLLSQNYPKQRYVATMTLLAWTFNQIKLIPYSLLGMINVETLWSGVYFLPAVIVGAFLGAWLNRRLGQKSFVGIIYTLLTIAGINLIYKAVMNLWG